jgi:PAS domain S-box-containing protein
VTPPSPTAILLQHAQRLAGLLGAADILAYLCREASAITGATLAIGSQLAPGEPWTRAFHVASGERDVTPAGPAVSAAFAVHRRLAMAPEPVILEHGEDTATIFSGLGANQSAIVCGVPFYNRRRRLSGQLVLVGGDRARIVESLTSVGELLALGALSLENAQRLAFARRDADRLQLLAEATDEALWDWNLENNAFWWGGGIENIVADSSELIGTTAGWRLSRIHPGDADAVNASFAAALQSSRSSWRHEYRFRRGEGSWAVVEDRAYFLRETNGRAYRVLGALRDISDKKWAEEQQGFLVRASSVLGGSLDVEKNLAVVAEVAATTVADACAIVLTAGEGRPRVVTVGHRDPAVAEAARTALLAAAHAPDTMKLAGVVGDFRAAEHALFSGGDDALARVLTLVAPRSLLHAPLRSGGGVIGHIVLATSADAMRSYRAGDVPFVQELAARCAVAVDKARLYEQAQSSIRARDAFMAILGHELRNPLSPITTALHLMKLRDPRATREHQVIERQVKHLTRLVDDLLDISRIERGKIELTQKPVQLAEIVAKAVEIASPLFEERRHRLKLDVPSAGLTILADETRVAQVVANLLTNAARYTDPGGDVTVSARRDGRQIELRVKDSGIGMSAELLPRVFELFVQGPRTADRRQGGLGLGLSLVRSLVQLHGGTVEARSDGPGKGSELIVRLPAMPVELVADAADDQASPAHAGGNGRRILLVDDNLDAAELLSELLRADGHEVAVAHDGPGALMIATRFAPELAILDIGLPVMDGYELARRLAAVLPVMPYMVALTGYGQEHDRRRAHEAGFDEHMVKPVDPERILRLIESMAAKRSVGESQ